MQRSGAPREVRWRGRIALPRGPGPLRFASLTTSPASGGGGIFIPRRQFIALLAIAAFARPFAARAQLAPNRPIRIIVPFAPAGSSDVLARLLQSPLQQALGQTVIVENRAGAGANIGMVEAARAEPDGYTLLLTSSALVVNPALYKNVAYDPAKDFAPIATLPVAPNVLAVNAKGNINSLSEIKTTSKTASLRAITASVAWVKRSRSCGGVPAGASKKCSVSSVTSGKPVSLKVGTSGRLTQRSFVVTASPRITPACTCLRAGERG